MKKLVTVIIFALATQFALAQKFSIKGKVVDENGEGLPSATVMILSQKDSALVSFKGTDIEGVFEVANLNAGAYLLKITYIGYNNFFKTVVAPPSADLGNLKLEPSSSQLDEVVIKGEANPVTVKRDTIEFNAGSFKTAVNANVEDLLKKLPGVEVDNDGVVTAQGETVQQVLVDGREFFGRDPKLATRGLPADAVKSVQVFDKKSDQSRFSGIDDGVRQKTINLELKEDRQNMTFGNVMAGGGADVKDSKLKLADNEDGRFTAKASVNRFGKGKQLSIVGMGNNVNEQGFTASDLGGAGGGGGGGGGNAGIAPGIATNYAAGINFNKDLSKKSKLTSNYFYNHTNRDLITNTDRLNFFPTGNNVYEGISKQLTTTDNHRATLRIDQDLDSANSITFVATPSYTRTDNNSTTNASTVLDDADRTSVNSTTSENISLQTSTNISSNLLWRHRFSKPGRTLSTNVTLAITNADADGSQNSENIYNPSLGLSNELIRQTSTQKTGNQTYGATLNYTEAAGRNKYLEFSYDFRTNINQVDKEVYDEGSGAKVFNPLYSNKYHSNYLYNRPGASFRFTQQMYNITLGASYQYSTLNGVLRDTVKIDRVFQNILPIVRMNYDFTTFKHLRLNYQTSMVEPSITQLNPVLDISNPINQSVGNPDLKVGYSHSGQLNYTSFNPEKFINFFATVNATYVLNPIVTSQTNLPGGKRLSKPVNVKDNTNLNANLNFGFPLTKLKSRFNFGPTARYSSGPNVINDVESNTIQQSYGGRVRYNLTIENLLNFELGANLNQVNTKYENVLAGQDQNYSNKTYSAEVTMPFYKSYWQLKSNFDYYLYDSKTTDLHTKIPMWNVAVSRFILKNKAGEIKLAVNNLLNKGQNVQQSVSSNALTTTTTNNLARYFMLTFTYALNKNLNPAAGRGQGGPGGFRN